jgi:hypothetical protein
MPSSARYMHVTRETKNTLSLSAQARLADIVDAKGIYKASEALGVGRVTIQAALDEVGISSRAARRLEQALAEGPRLV